MAVLEQMRGMGRDLSRYQKEHTQGIFIITIAWCFLFVGTGSKDGKVKCEVFPVHGRHLDISTNKMEVEKSNSNSQSDI